MSEPQASATVVTLRDTRTGIEVLLLRKNSQLAYGGMWVFPGGKIDAADYGADPQDLLLAARNAAAREAKEEANITFDVNALHFFAHWLTPVIRPRRFSTWFFLGLAREHEDAVTIDGGEIHDFCWRTPEDLLLAHQQGAIELVPPTYVTLVGLQRFQCFDHVLAQVNRTPPRYFAPKVSTTENGFCHLYAGDAGYETQNPEQPGSRHRLEIAKTGLWQYQKDEGF